MLNALPFGIAYVVPLVLAVALVFGGATSWATPAVVFVVIPVLDALFGLNTRNVEDEDAAKKHWLYQLWLVLFVPTQLAVIGATVWIAAFGSRPTWEVAGLVVSCGIVTGGLGITIAHELMHRRGRFERALAEVLMTSVTYSHFCVEHVLGHHKNVATPEDPATSRFGESVYRFLPRSLIGSLSSAWRLEGRRVKSQGVRGVADRRLRYPLILLCVYAGIGAWAGLVGVLAFAAQSVIAFSLLEIINYIEHYGLRRRQLANGRYERVQPHHSWNSSHRITGWYLFGLPRHADHHFLASRPYAILRHLPDGPQMPAGYATMFLLALVPPAWHAVMDPRVEALQGRARVDEDATPRAA